MTPLSDLIARLEAAKEGSRELDWEIYWAYHPNYNGGSISKIRTNEDREILDHLVPTYTTSLDAALTLVPEDLSWAVKSPGFQSLRKTFLVELESDDYQWCGEGWNPALALCIAALRAREAAR